MFPWCFEDLRRAAACVALLALAGCVAQPARDGNVDRRSDNGAAPTARPVTPATVQVDEGLGFTVTEVATLGSDAREAHREALQRLAAANTAAAIELLRTVIERVPEATAPYIDLGIALGRQGAHEEAVEALTSAVAVTPEHPVAHNELGIAYRRLGRFEDARRSYERALAVYPGFHYARRNLAVLCDLYLADLECALENYRAYQASVVEDAEVDMWLADLRNRMPTGSQEM